jgi:hypothetical protein
MVFAFWSLRPLWRPGRRKRRRQSEHSSWRGGNVLCIVIALLEVCFWLHFDSENKGAMCTCSTTEKSERSATYVCMYSRTFFALRSSGHRKYLFWIQPESTRSALHLRRFGTPADAQCCQHVELFCHSDADPSRSGTDQGLDGGRRRTPTKQLSRINIFFTCISCCALTAWWSLRLSVAEC